LLLLLLLLLLLRTNYCLIESHLLYLISSPASDMQASIS